MVRGLRALCAAHRRITDARARIPARWRIADGLSWGAEGQLMTQGLSRSRGIGAGWGARALIVLSGLEGSAVCSET